MLASIEVQVLAQAGQLQQAEELVRQISAARPGLETNRLTRIIEEAKGSDPIGTREALFASSNSLTDLANLVELLKEREDWRRLGPYAKQLFERTRDLSAFSIACRALFEAEEYDALCALMRGHVDLVEQSNDLQGILAWSYYRLGELSDAEAVLSKLRSKRENSGDRALTINLAITSGDWHALLPFIEDEWQKRHGRDALDLLRAGQLAHHLGSPRAKDLIYEAATKAQDNAEILVGCYSMATSAGWEDLPEVFSWLERAANLSGENGPVQRFSLREIVNLHPDWQRRENQAWERLQAGELPIFGAARLLNRSLVDMFLLPALGNLSQVDPRKRGAVFAYSGTRAPVAADTRTIALDATALLTAGLLGFTRRMLDVYDQLTIPHSTLAWLFEERQRIQFHQPSKIKDAFEIKRLLDTGALQKFESTTALDHDLAAEVGDDLAALIAEAGADFGEDRRQRLVVRSSPVYRLASLMEEEADLAKHQHHICGCLDLLDALKREGQLTQAEEQRARAYLALQETPWSSKPAIESGAVLYLDSVAVSYLQHLRLLPKIRAAGFKGVIAPSEVEQANALIRYDALTSEASEILERLRADLAEAIKAGKVRIARAVHTAADEDQRLGHHPTISILPTAEVADAVVVDDRFVNQHGWVEGRSKRKPLYTSCDVITHLAADENQLAEYRTNLRRAGLCFVPIEAGELSRAIGQAGLSNGQVVETAELKAIRENLLLARMTNALQFQKEHVWWAGLVRACFEVMKTQWTREVDDALARARSDWLLNLFDVRGWAHRVRAPGTAGDVQARYRAQILMLATLLIQAPAPVRERYWEWLEGSVLTRLKDEQREFFASIVAQARTIAEEAGSRIPDEVRP